MKIVYIGQPGTNRAHAWTSFFEAQGATVRHESLASLGSLTFSSDEIAVVDGKVYEEPRVPERLKLEDLPVPTVLVSGVGGQVADAIGLKLGWSFGCLCLNYQALPDYAAPQDHPVFTGPFAVPAPDVKSIPTSEAMLTLAATKDIPATLNVAEMYEPDEEELAGESFPGLVSTSADFLDSPDCEHILSGVNSKAPDYNAVARQGRFLQWGFDAVPQRFTGYGQALLLNAIAYIESHREAEVEALVMQTYPRTMLRNVLGLIERPEIGSPRSLLASQFAVVPDGIGHTSESAVGWFDTHRGFIRFTGVGADGHYALDEDLIALGLSNDDPALLERLSGDLDADGEAGDRARALWHRYVGREVRDSAVEVAWWRTHRDRLFFSDWAGYRWIARDDLPTFEVPRFGAAEASSAYLWLTASRSGDAIRANLHVNLLPGDYVYGEDATDGMPTTVRVVSDHDSDPVALPHSDDHHLSGRFSVPLTLRGDARRVEVEVRFQVCNAQTCSLPLTVRVDAEIGEAA